MDDELKEALEASLDIETDDHVFYEVCDELLKLKHGDKARYWLAMLEDPDPDDLIFEYNRIIRTEAYKQGYVNGWLAAKRGSDPTI